MAPKSIIPAFFIPFTYHMFRNQLFGTTNFIFPYYLLFAI
jgi:hypothetical protein